MSKKTFQATFPTEFVYHTEYPADWPFEGSEAYVETGTLSLLVASDYWTPEAEYWTEAYAKYWKPSCEGCGEPAMWASTPDDMALAGYTRMNWCTPCWFDRDGEVEL